MKIIFTFLLVSVSLIGFGQDLKYARQVLDTLCSPSMHGRGCENGGERTAAEYIAGEFKKFGLKSYSENYFQEFPIKRDINTYPEKMALSVNGTALKGGKDFICMPFSKCAKGTHEAIWYNKELLADRKAYKKFKKTNLSDKFLISDKSGVTDENQLKYFKAMRFNPFQAKGVLILEEKLTQERMAPKLYPFIVLNAMRSSVPTNTNELSVDLECITIKDYQTQNVIGYIEGTEQPDSFIVFSAHYDHLGRMGKETYFPGANDNASGTAMLLNLVKHFEKHPPKVSVAFMAFGAEEQGLVGSFYYTANPLFPLTKIKFLVNMDIFGTGDEGIMVVNATVHTKAFATLLALNEIEEYLVKVGLRGAAAISDHHPFSEKGVPAFYMYTLGGTKAYHDIYDRAETLPLTEFEDIFRLLTDFVHTFE